MTSPALPKLAGIGKPRGDALDPDARIFVARFTRDLSAKQALGTGMLSPGTITWKAAFNGFGDVLAKAKGPVKAAAVCRAAQLRMIEAQQAGACFVNYWGARKRSATFQILTWEVEQHPLLKHGYAGITVRRYSFLQRRNGCVECGWSKLAHIGWHALARMWSRSSVDIFAARGVVTVCGIAGQLLRFSPPHFNSEINLAFEDFVCTGVLRVGDEGPEHYRFYDVLTVLEANERTARKCDQGAAIAHAAWTYVTGDDADPTGCADDIPVLPFHESDYVTRELRARITAA